MCLRKHEGRHLRSQISRIVWILSQRIREKYKTLNPGPVHREARDNMSPGIDSDATVSRRLTNVSNTFDKALRAKQESNSLAVFCRDLPGCPGMRACGWRDRHYHPRRNVEQNRDTTRKEGQARGRRGGKPGGKKPHGNHHTPPDKPTSTELPSRAHKKQKLRCSSHSHPGYLRRASPGLAEMRPGCGCRGRRTCLKNTGGEVNTAGLRLSFCAAAAACAVSQCDAATARWSLATCLRRCASMRRLPHLR